MCFRFMFQVRLKRRWVGTYFCGDVRIPSTNPVTRTSLSPPRLHYNPQNARRDFHTRRVQHYGSLQIGVSMWTSLCFLLRHVPAIKSVLLTPVPVTRFIDIMIIIFFAGIYLTSLRSCFPKNTIGDKWILRLTWFISWGELQFYLLCPLVIAMIRLSTSLPKPPHQPIPSHTKSFRVTFPFGARETCRFCKHVHVSLSSVKTRTRICTLKMRPIVF